MNEEDKLYWKLRNEIMSKEECINLINQFKSEICKERDSIWFDSIANCDILTDENIVMIKEAVTWHDKPNNHKR